MSCFLRHCLLSKICQSEIACHVMGGICNRPTWRNQETETWSALEADITGSSGGGERLRGRLVSELITRLVSALTAYASAVGSAVGDSTVVSSACLTARLTIGKVLDGLLWCRIALYSSISYCRIFLVW